MGTTEGEYLHGNELHQLQQQLWGMERKNTTLEQMVKIST